MGLSVRHQGRGMRGHTTRSNRASDPSQAIESLADDRETVG